MGSPQMVVVSDLEELFLPIPDDALWPLNDQRDDLLALLDQIPLIFGETKVQESCMGSAVIACFLSQKEFGGKLIIFSATPPTLGKAPVNPNRHKQCRTEIDALKPVRFC
jgi:protein transport protein SEC24